MCSCHFAAFLLVAQRLTEGIAGFLVQAFDIVTSCGAMPLCRSRHVTPLARHAKHLQAEPHAEAAMPFPMYTVPLQQALEMTCVEPHEKLKAKGLLVEFEKNCGKAMFLSHEWTGKDHPDPTFAQFSVFQDAMKHILLGRFSHIELDYVTEALVPQSKPLPTREFRSAQLFLWYDYFSCPQLKELHNDQVKAIASIHAYVAQCSFFFALCPFLQDPVTSKVLCPSSWEERGWCRLERTMRELSEGSWVLIKSAERVELVVASRALGCPTGEGDFTVVADRVKLGPILAAALKGKMKRALTRSDFVTYRVVRNLQSVYLRGLETQPELDVVPGWSCNADGPVSIVEQFFYQNGLWNIHEVDSAGFLPLHYAALLGGEPQVIKAMLELRADFSRTTRKAQPLLGIPPWTSALGLALACGHNDAAQILIKAKAKVQETGVLSPALHLAAAGNNVEGIRLLVEAGCDPITNHTIFGFSGAAFACDLVAPAALEELLRYGVSISGLLHATAESSRGGSGEVARQLIELKADIDEQCQVQWLTPLGALVALQSLRYRWTDTALTRHLYHLPGSTPLMMAILSGNYEIAMTLLREGARVDLRNARNVSAADLAEGAPQLLQEILTGDSIFCRV